MIIKTKCNGCVFLDKEKSTCGAGFPVFTQDSEVYIDGFCSIKRIQGEKTKEEVLEEERKVTGIILLKSQPICRAKDLIMMTRDVFSQFIIFAFCKPKEEQIELIEFAKEQKIDIHIENVFIREEQYQDHTFIDYLVNKVKNNWFMVMVPSDILLTKKIKNFALDAIINDNKVCAYFDDLRILVNKYAFLSLRGNREMPFLVKMQKFENWSDKCLPLE